MQMISPSLYSVPKMLIQLIENKSFGAASIALANICALSSLSKLNYFKGPYSMWFKGEVSQLDQGLIIGQVENVVRFEQFIKSTLGACGLTGDKMPAHDNLESIDVVWGAAHSKDVRLLALWFPQVFINAAV